MWKYGKKRKSDGKYNLNIFQIKLISQLISVQNDKIAIKIRIGHAAFKFDNVIVAVIAIVSIHAKYAWKKR